MYSEAPLGCPQLARVAAGSSSPPCPRAATPGQHTRAQLQGWKRGTQNEAGAWVAAARIDLCLCFVFCFVSVSARRQVQERDQQEGSALTEAHATIQGARQDHRTRRRC